MTKEILYTYLGTNGTITSPVHLEDIYYARSVRLSAGRNKKLTKDGENFFSTVIVSEDEVNLWREVAKQD